MSRLKLLPDEPLIDANELARRLGVSRSWIYQQVQAGQLPFIRVGVLLRFIPSEVLAALQGGGKAA
jgi:excisionase family DNA binding protein